jgi:hypothetical protein
MSGSHMQLQLERALALVHAVLAEPTERRADEARRAAHEAAAAVETVRRGSWTLSEGHDLLAGLERLQRLVDLLDHSPGAERVA